MDRKASETVHELASSRRQDAVTCEFSSIKDPLDEAMRTSFICSLNNEAVLKAMFKVKDDGLTFARAIHLAIEMEEAAKVAKETVYGQQPKLVNKVQLSNYRCDKTGHNQKDCRYKHSTCNYCKNREHLEAACRKKKGRVHWQLFIDTITTYCLITSVATCHNNSHSIYRHSCGHSRRLLILYW